MTARAQEKTRLGGAGSMWSRVAREIARVFYQGAPLFVLGLSIGWAFGLEGRL
jgi:hypothetical protein